jgi:hypothetical protein
MPKKIIFSIATLFITGSAAVFALTTTLPFCISPATTNPITIRAFQKAYGISQVGVIGPITRAKLRALGCGTNGNTPIVPLTGATITPITTGGTVQTMCAQGATGCADVIVTKPKVLIPIGCVTMAYRACPDGAAMPRDASCNWHPEQCSTSQNGISPLNASNTDVVIPTPVVINPNVTTNGQLQVVTQSPVPKSFTATTTPPVQVNRPTGIMCTMEMRLCPNGDPMYRDSSCGWHPENCAASTNNGMQCTKDPVTGQTSCGAGTGAILQTY